MVKKGDRMTVQIIKEPPGLIPVMVVSFNTIEAAQESFDRFYHTQFLPGLFNLSPQLRGIKRYENYERQSLWPLTEGNADDQSFGAEPLEPGAVFTTVYQLDSEETLANTDAIFGHIDFAATLFQFRQYKESALSDFSRLNYRQLSGLRRQYSGVELAKLEPAYLCILSFLLDKQNEGQFFEWYLGQYQDLVVFEIDKIHSCRTYQSVGQGTSEILSIFEIADRNLVDHCLELIIGQLIAPNSPFYTSIVSGTVSRPLLTAASPIFALP